MSSYTLALVIQGRRALICARDDATVGDAIAMMLTNRVAQLPVVAEDGRLRGVISQQSILSMYFFTKGDAPLFDMAVDHVLEPAAILTENENLFRAVDLLTTSGRAAAVVVREGQPFGILTGKDMTHFFRGLFEGMILIERIELGLREQVAAAYPDEDALNAAAIAAFGPDPENPQYALRNPHKLSFGDRLMLIADDDNWPTFELVLGPRVVFLHLMERVRQVRNELMHFNGQLDSLERDVLVRADSWLQQRPRWPALPQEWSAQQ